MRVSEFPTEVPPVITELLRAAPESFQEPRHGQIAVAIRELTAGGFQVHVLSVRDWLAQNQHLEEAGGETHLNSIAGAGTLPLALAEYEAEALWKAYLSRLFRNSCAQALEDSKRGTDLSQVVAAVRKNLDVIAPPPKPPVGLTIRRPDEILLMTFEESDNLLGDRLLCRGESLVIAGQGGVGKSRLLLQLAVSVILSQPFCGLPTRGAAKATGYERAGFGRNSKVLHAWTAGQLNVAPGSPHGNDVLVISCAKNRNGREFAPFAVRLDAGSMIYAPDSDFDLVRWQGEINGTKQSKPQMTPGRARELCSAPKTKKELASAIREDCGCSRESSYRYAQKAVKAGTIQWNADAKVFSATE